MVSSLALACALLAGGTPGSSTSAPAGDAAPELRSPLRGVVTLGYDVPLGDPVTLVTLGQNGPSTSEVRLNGGVVAAAGVAFAPRWGAPIELQATIGVKRSAAVAGGARIAYRAFPLEVLAAWRARSIRVAAGLSLALDASVEGEDLVGPFAADPRTSLGLLGQVEWTQRVPGAWLGSSFGARVLWQTLQEKGGGTVGASAIGLFAGLSF